MTVQLGDTVQTETECPFCLSAHDAATSMTDESGSTPTPGCFSICANCSNLSVFMEDMKLRKATKEDLDPLSSEEKEDLMHARKVALLATLDARTRKGEDIDGIALVNLGV